MKTLTINLNKKEKFTSFREVSKYEKLILIASKNISQPLLEEVEEKINKLGIKFVFQQIDSEQNLFWQNLNLSLFVQKKESYTPPTPSFWKKVQECME